MSSIILAGGIALGSLFVIVASAAVIRAERKSAQIRDRILEHLEV